MLNGGFAADNPMLIASRRLIIGGLQTTLSTKSFACPILDEIRAQWFLSLRLKEAA